MATYAAAAKKATKPKTAFVPVKAPPAVPTAPAAPVLEPFVYQHTRSVDVDQLCQNLQACDVVGCHFELMECDSQRAVVVLAIAWSSTTSAPRDDRADAPTPPWVIHEDGSSVSTLVALMRVLLSEPSVIKVVHGVRAVASWLTKHGLDASPLAKVVDLQLHYECHLDTNVRDASMAVIAKRSGTLIGSFRDVVKASSAMSDLEKHLLPHKAILAMIPSATLLATCYSRSVMTTTSHAQRTALHEMTARRWAYAGRYDGNASRVPGLGSPLATIVPMLQLQCEIESLLALLPDRYRDAVLALDNAREKLVDINLDVGRLPHGYMGYRQRIVLGGTASVHATEAGQMHPSQAHTFDAHGLAAILERLGGEAKIGSDNRAGVDRQLHRISVMRDKTGTIYGLTMRVGRTIQFAFNFLLDLLLSATHRRKSVLLLGRPGSGKTTLIRDIARCVSETGENVCIIDTSNEIGGDGLVPHECIGWACRMMVKSLNDQASVMVECVQNHTVETLIVDEIGRKAEVNAAGTVRQRGPRLITRAHGDFRSLIKNEDLKGLIGGVQTVTVGDEEAKKNPQLGKMQAKRMGNPIFDVIVELDDVHRGRCRIIWDVAEAVDDVLSGDTDYTFETRLQTFGRRGVEVLDQ